MKKLLGLLAATGLVATTSATVVACGETGDKEANKLVKDVKNFIEKNEAKLNSSADEKAVIDAVNTKFKATGENGLIVKDENDKTIKADSLFLSVTKKVATTPAPKGTKTLEFTIEVFGAVVKPTTPSTKTEPAKVEYEKGKTAIAKSEAKVTLNDSIAKVSDYKKALEAEGVKTHESAEAELKGLQDVVKTEGIESSKIEVKVAATNDKAATYTVTVTLKAGFASDLKDKAVTFEVTGSFKTTPEQGGGQTEPGTPQSL
ncbi:lipoprotein [Spiroplasma sp. BIUS-1]|uniref:lipoprotein n=1 Tax=Spiroplasma sp. BIUS-1 TaxID=216964 RepID=UPI0013982578|nr:lipoprotein [Spiroplasma sp. BIUS-1]QHX36662.1 hypothetical protein SBIUS_v1c04090 [Spiroplasma sp. BIUS-1]